MMTTWAFSWSLLYFNRSATRDGASADYGCIIVSFQNEVNAFAMLETTVVKLLSRVSRRALCGIFVSQEGFAKWLHYFY